MFDPIPIHLARDRVRTGIEGPVPERSPTRARVRVATLLHRLAYRVEGRSCPDASQPVPFRHEKAAQGAAP